MNTPLALPDYSALAEWTPKVGEIIENFGCIARVLEDDLERGLLVREISSGQKWHADPAKCRPVR